MGIKKVAYEIGKLISVAADICIACPKNLQARFGVGNKAFQTKQSVESEGQNIPVGFQVLTPEEQKANPGKYLMVTEGQTRFEIARALGRELLGLVHAPYSAATILQRNISANGPKSDVSCMDVCVMIHNSIAVGFTEPDIRKMLAFVAGRGKTELGKQRYVQYSRLKDLPAEIQLAAHLGTIRLDAVLHMTNAKRTAEQFSAIMAQALDTRSRLAKEEYDRDALYIKREQDNALKAAFAGELPKDAPVYIARTRAKGVVSAAEPLVTDEIKGAEVDLGMQGKNVHKVDPAIPVVEGSVNGKGVLSTEEWDHLAQQMKARGELMEVVGSMLLEVATRKVSEAAFCADFEIFLQKLSPKSKAKASKRELVAQ